MAYTRAQIRDLIRQRCDLENTTAQTDTEINMLINDSARYVHDFLIGAYGERYAMTAYPLTTVAGVSLYAIGSRVIPVAADKFYRPIALKLRIDGISYPLTSYETAGSTTMADLSGAGTSMSWGLGSLPRYNLSIVEDDYWYLYFDPAPDTVHTVEIFYHPTAPQYTADSGSGGVVYLPHTDLLVVEAAIRMKTKEERDASSLKEERALIQKRIEDWTSPVDTANPMQTLRASNRSSRAIWRRERMF
jgi:hypothetical protein